ncbi:glutamate racemase [Granulicatella sp. zg-ZJ]|nr:glutamate racemase [Granulicatella sp. zg-ZJ]
MMNKQPIGFIDSGVGGLTVVKESLNQLPNETIYYLGDSARCPYGPRTPEEVRQFTWEMVHFLLEKNIKLLVIACNTATAAVLPEIKQKLSIPVIGVIDPGSRAAISKSKNKRIGVIGTTGTIQSGVYERTLKNKKQSIHVFNLPCPKFVGLVEENKMNTTDAQETVLETLSTLKEHHLDTLILGCTHYPLLKEHIQNAMGEHVTLIDSGVETITDVSMLLDYFDIASTHEGEKHHRFFTTGNKEQFEKVAKQWLNMPELDVEVISLEKYQKVTQMEKVLLIATKNKGKAREFEQIFGEKGYSVKTLLDYPDIEDIEETGTTFEENARLKAESIAQRLNVMVIADDSGLMVDALHGEPGVYSARYAGEPKSDTANNAKLLSELAGVPKEQRTATFHCTLVLARPNEQSIVASGNVRGEILTVPKGENGFGYDPLFYIEEYGKTTAEMTPEEKNKISHRKKAIQHLLSILPQEVLS